MAMSGAVFQTKRSNHKKISSVESTSTSKKKNQRSAPTPEEQDDSETDLDKPLLKLPSHGMHSGHHLKTTINSQSANGRISDSETDIDKPQKQSVSSKSVARTQSVARSHHSQPVVNKFGSVNNEEEDDSDSENEPQSISLLQLHTAKLSPEKRSQSGAKHLQKSGNNSSQDGGVMQGKVLRRPNVREMSSSEVSDSEEEIHQHQPVPQHQPELEEEEEEEEPESAPAVYQSVRIKQEDSSSFEEEEDEDEPSSWNREVPTLPEVYRGTPHPTSNESRSVGVQREMPPNREDSSRELSNYSNFEEEHTPVSAPVIDIPPDSRVWFLQVPHSIQASHLRGQHLPEKLKGDEVMDLPSGRWKILEQPCELRKSTINCIVSTGHLSYGMRWLQPKTFQFLKCMPTPIQKKTPELSLTEEVHPLSVEELLKMKSKKTFTNTKLQKPSRKRTRDSDPDLPSKRYKTVLQEDTDTSQQSPRKKKKKAKLYTDDGRAADVTVMRADDDKGKKRKRTSEDKESPTKKKKKSTTGNQSYLENIQSGSRLDVDATMIGETSSSKSERTKRKKHKEGEIDSIEKLRSPVLHCKIKQEYSANEDEWRECPSENNQEGSGISRKQKKKSHIREDAVAIGAQYMETEHNDSKGSVKKIKKKEGKQRDAESEHGESFQESKKKNKKDVKTDTIVERKKKSKHHSKEPEAKGSIEEIEVKNASSLVVEKKKKKQKHKDFEKIKVKQEDFWERETSPDFLSRLYLTQVAPEDQ